VFFLYAVSIGVSCLLSTDKLAPESAQPSPDGKVLWYDCKQIRMDGKGWTDTPAFYDRLPSRAKNTAPELDWRFSHCSAGFCVYFSTDAPSLQVRWTLLEGNLAMPHMPATGVSGVDLYARTKGGPWQFVNNGRPSDVTNTAEFAPPAGSECLLYFPLYNGVKSVEIGIPKGKSLWTPDKAAFGRRKSVVFYGTSIVQGACASRPGMAFTAIAGRQLDANMINLGFSGSGKMESAMADLLAELDPSVYVLDGLWNMSVKEVEERVAPFVEKLRAVHARTPILLVEEANFRNVCPTDKGRALRAVLDTLRSRGVTNVHLLTSQDVLGSDTEATVDGVHPNDLGMMRQAAAVTKALLPLLHQAE
jgi:lysophospholipase L1-like esterase